MISSCVVDVYKKYKNLHHQIQSQSTQTVLKWVDTNNLATNEHSNQQNEGTPIHDEISTRIPAVTVAHQHHHTTHKKYQKITLTELCIVIGFFFL
jgi:hypothetical protein